MKVLDRSEVLKSPLLQVSFIPAVYLYPPTLRLTLFAGNIISTYVLMFCLTLLSAGGPAGSTSISGGLTSINAHSRPTTLSSTYSPLLTNANPRRPRCVKYCTWKIKLRYYTRISQKHFVWICKGYVYLTRESVTNGSNLHNDTH